MERLRGVAALLGLVIVVGAACSGGDESSVDGSGDSDGSPSVETTSVPAVGGEDGDFPIPLPPGDGVVVFSTAFDRIVNFPQDEFDRLVAFYDDWTASEPDGYERTEASNGAVEWSSRGDDLTRVRGIIVAPNAPGPDGAVASVSVVAASG